MPLNRTETLNEAIGLKIRKLRIRRRITQERLAEKVSMSRASIVNIEHGRHELAISRFCAIAKALRVSPAKLMP